MRWRFTSIFLVIIALFTVLFSYSCHRESAETLRLWMQDNGKLKVLCTTAMITDLVKHVGGDAIDCYTLIQDESDPHSYQLVKGDDEKFQRADLVFYNGLGLEHSPGLLQQLHQSTKAYSLGDFLYKNDPGSILKCHETLDPHIWMDLSLFAKNTSFIAQVLGLKLPEKKNYFSQNGLAYERKLLELHQEIVELFQQIPQEKRYLVTTHDAFCYFTRAYLATGDEKKSSSFFERCQAPEGLAPESQLSTHDISRLLQHIIRYRIHSMFAESNISQDSLKKLLDACQRKGISMRIAQATLYGDAMGAPGSSADTYEKMMWHNAQVIYKEFSHE